MFSTKRLLAGFTALALAGCGSAGGAGGGAGGTGAGGGPGGGGAPGTGGAPGPGADRDGGSPATLDGAAGGNGGAPGTGGGGGAAGAGAPGAGGAPGSGGGAPGGAGGAAGPGAPAPGVMASAGCVGAAAVAGEQRRTLSIDGSDRSYFVVVPAAGGAGKPLPLVFAWHGLGGSGALARRYFGVEAAAAGKAVLVYPDALPLPGFGNRTGWNLTAEGPDLRFFDAMLAAGVAGRLRGPEPRVLHRDTASAAT